MTESVSERFRRSEIAALLVRYPGLRLVPSRSMDLRIEGALRFCANGQRTEVIEDGYDVCIEATVSFPERMAMAWETGGRIPPNYHKLTNDALCLGSRVGLRLQMGGSPSLLRFVERCVIPYLYGYSYFVKHGAPPFGELEHGELGSLQDLASLLGVEDLNLAFRYSALAATKRRRANRQPCPCSSGRRLGRCHNRKVNALRNRVGRLVLVSEMRTIVRAFREHSLRKRSPPARDETVPTKSNLFEMIREMRRPTIPPWVRPMGQVLQHGPAWSRASMVKRPYLFSTSDDTAKLRRLRGSTVSPTSSYLARQVRQCGIPRVLDETVDAGSYAK